MAVTIFPDDTVMQSQIGQSSLVLSRLIGMGSPEFQAGLQSYMEVIGIESETFMLQPFPLDMSINFLLVTDNEIHGPILSCPVLAVQAYHWRWCHKNAMRPSTNLEHLEVPTWSQRLVSETTAGNVVFEHGGPIWAGKRVKQRWKPQPDPNLHTGPRGLTWGLSSLLWAKQLVQTGGNPLLG